MLISTKQGNTRNLAIQLLCGDRYAVLITRIRRGERAISKVSLMLSTHSSNIAVIFLQGTRAPLLSQTHLSNAVKTVATPIPSLSPLAHPSTTLEMSGETFTTNSELKDKIVSGDQPRPRKSRTDQWSDYRGHWGR